MDVVEARPARSRLYAAGLVAAGLVAGVVLAGLNVATAQTGPAPAPPGAGAESKGDLRHLKGGGHRHGRGFAGPAGALHGEFTAPKPGGGYQTLAMQRGEVTAVSATSVTVKSEDGFSRSYDVTDDTLVNAGDDGIADVKTGDTVHVIAVVSGAKASAVRVMDVTNVTRLRDRWHPRRPGAAKPSPTATT